MYDAFRSHELLNARESVMNELKTYSEPVYYGDLCNGPNHPPTLTQSIARLLIHKSPMHAWRSHPRLGNVEQDTTDAMEKGTVIHAMLSGDIEPVGVTVLDHENYRSKAARDARDRLRAAGITPMLRHEYEECVGAAVSVLKYSIGQLAGLGVSMAGQKEGVALWTERASNGNEVHCRARIDLWDGLTWIDDYKTTTNAHPDVVQAKIISDGLDLQGACYRSALSKLFPQRAEELRFRNLFVEVREPHLITPIIHDDSVNLLGLSKWKRAIDIWERCLRTGVWPGYCTEPIVMSAPSHALNREADSIPSKETDR